MPSFVIAYPEGSNPPLLVATDNPHENAWLPENPDEDFMVVKNPRTGKFMVTSPSLGFSQYVTCLLDIVIAKQNILKTIIGIYMYVFIWFTFNHWWFQPPSLSFLSIERHCPSFACLPRWTTSWRTGAPSDRVHRSPQWPCLGKPATRILKGWHHRMLLCGVIKQYVCFPLRNIILILVDSPYNPSKQ